ncbi:MAG: recombinase family protein [Oscillospiraceae bacterium]|nr:recombinase family protein [Oscillospiraceae bacterium]
MDLHREKVLRYAAQLGYANPVIYADNGASGLTFDRPVFSAMNTDIVTGKIDAVIFLSLSHIGRNINAIFAWLNRMQNNGVDVIACYGSLAITANWKIENPLLAPYC